MSGENGKGVVNTNVDKTELPKSKYSLWGSLFGTNEEQQHYQEFMSKENSLEVHIAFSVIGMLVNIFITMEGYFGNFSDGFGIYFYQRFAIVPPLFFHLYSVFQKQYPETLHEFPIPMIYLGDAVLLSYSICFGIFLYGMATANSCESPPDSARIMSGHIPVESAVAYIAVSLMLSVLIKCRHLVAVVLSIVIELFFVALIVYIVEPSFPNVVMVGIVTLAQFFVACDCDVYSWRLYLHLIQSQNLMHSKIMSDNENVVMEMQATELRFLIGNVAHDLKTPLQAFSFELEQMKGKSVASEGQNESISLLESICSFMLMTINRAIDYTKVTSGIQLKPSMETVDVSEVFNWVKLCVSHTVNTTKVPIVIDPLPDDMCNFIITDKQWLMENLLCLISNAQKFTAQGKICVKCSFVGGCVTTVEGCNASSDMSQPSMAMVEVIDDGIGISAEMQKVLFKPFKQAMRRAGGTGLGIYSLSKRVECLGGTCGVSSRADGKRGARFWFQIPYRPDITVAAAADVKSQLSPPEKELTRTKSIQNEIRNEKSYECNKNDVSGYSCASDDRIIDKNMKPSGRIMLVEDSPLIQKTCSRMLLREGISVDIANNGLECVEKVTTARGVYSVILMDINMPLMDGLEATTRLRNWERNHDKEHEDDFPELLIIGVSANSDSVSRQQALDSGMDHFISKPMKLPVFRASLAEFSLDLDSFKVK